ncbi:hypothetical protein [Dickeya zeae]|uniref:Uncharacterized protein n=1 Tax=Dickeya zeae TaxID=204042 RepID=A0AAE6YXE7_9GAMM|nr:hypothetical protein [Dickeya zeae]MCO7263399.1 hypothetical protein [Dickeya zeae]QIZ50236.1 hypothetical protein DWG24_05235 [Dickeya zeae]QYM93902.1 hypothetical protein FGI21_19500 [Dickeya zeae]
MKAPLILQQPTKQACTRNHVGSERKKKNEFSLHTRMLTYGKNKKESPPDGGQRSYIIMSKTLVFWRGEVFN